MENNLKTPIQVMVSPELKLKIREFCSRNECTSAQAVRMAIISFFEKSYSQSEAVNPTPDLGNRP